MTNRPWTVTGSRRAMMRAGGVAAYLVQALP
jgi:hypothetical protein